MKIDVLLGHDYYLTKNFEQTILRRVLVWLHPPVITLYTGVCQTLKKTMILIIFVVSDFLCYVRFIKV